MNIVLPVIPDARRSHGKAVAEPIAVRAMGKCASQNPALVQHVQRPQRDSGQRAYVLLRKTRPFPE